MIDRFLSGLIASRKLIYFLLILILIVGIWCFRTTTREVDPKGVYPDARILTLCPAYSALETEDKVTKPLENAISGIDRLSKLISLSGKGFSWIFVRFDRQITSEAKIDELLGNLRSRLETVKLPETVSSPEVQKASILRVAAMVVTLRSNNPARRQFADFTDEINHSLKNVSTISAVEIEGLPKQEVEITLDLHRLQDLKLDPNAVLRAIQAQNLSAMAGEQISGQELATVRLTGDFQTLEEIAAIPVGVSPLQFSDIRVPKPKFQIRMPTPKPQIEIQDIPPIKVPPPKVSLHTKWLKPEIRIEKIPEITVPKPVVKFKLDLAQPKVVMEEMPPIQIHQPTSRVVILGEIAKVSVVPAKPIFLVRSANSDVVALNIFRRENADANLLSHQVKDELSKTLKRYPEISSKVIFDQAEDTQNKEKEFLITLFTAVLLVMLVPLALVGLRCGIIILISLPLSFALSFFLLKNFGVHFHQVSLYTLVVAVGLVVDDATIMAERIFVNLGLGIRQSVITSFREMARPTSFSTLTICLVFASFFAWGGSTGNYIKAMPQVLLTTLGASLLVSLVFVPVVSQLIIGRSNRENWANRGINPNSFLNFYRQLLRKLIYGETTKIENRIWVLLGLLVFLSSAVFVIPRLPKRLFPNAEVPYLVLNYQLADSTTLEFNRQATQEIEKIIVGQFHRPYLAFLGWGIPEIHYSIFRDLPFANRSQILIRFDSPSEASEMRSQILDSIGKIRTLKSFSLSEIKQGPPLGEAIAVWVQGPDLRVLEQIGNKIGQNLKQIKGAKDVKVDAASGQKEIRLVPKRIPAQTEGVLVADLAQLMQIYFYGANVGEINLAGQVMPIIARCGQEKSLASIPVFSRLKQRYVPLACVAKITEADSARVIHHLNLKRAITVSSGVESGYSVAPIVTQLKAKQPVLPLGYSVIYGGEIEEEVKVFKRFGIVLLLALAAMWIIHGLQFRSFRLPGAIASKAVIAFVGSLWGLYFVHQPIGMMAMVGSITLVGIVYYTGVVLVDFIVRIKD